MDGWRKMRCMKRDTTRVMMRMNLATVQYICGIQQAISCSISRARIFAECRCAVLFFDRHQRVCARALDAQFSFRPAYPVPFVGIETHDKRAWCAIAPDVCCNAKLLVAFAG